MITKNQPKKFKHESPQFLVCDFETTTLSSEYYHNNWDGRIIAFAVLNLDTEERTFGVSFNEFSKFINSIERNTILFFHNLAFDGLVILNSARNQWKSDYNTVNSDIYFTYTMRKNKILIMDIINRYEVHIRVQCSFRLLSQSIAALGKAVGAPKLETDYHIEPVARWEDLPEDYREYLFRDIEIQKAALNQFRIGLTNLYQELEIPGAVEWYKTTAAGVSRALISVVQNQHKKKYHASAFMISGKSQKEAKGYYRGGFTMTNIDYLRKQSNGSYTMFDAKSMYPSVIYDRALPVGEPVVIEVSNDFNRKVAFHALNSLVKRYGSKYVPAFVKVAGVITSCKTNWGVIQHPDQELNLNVNPFTREQYINKNDLKNGSVKFIFNGTYYEWEQVRKFYEFKDLRYLEIVYWKKTTSALKPVIKKLYDGKEFRDETGARPWALTYKIILNSIYGSLGMSQVDFTETFWASDEELQHLEKKKGLKVVEGKTKPREKFMVNPQPHKIQPFKGYGYKVFELEEQDKEFKGKIYWNRWIAAAITSWARADLFHMISIDPDSVVYCDTDSLLMCKDSGIIPYIKEHKLQGSNLKQWEEEEGANLIEDIIIQGSKLYEFRDKDKNIIKLGMVGIDKQTYLETRSTNLDLLADMVFIENGLVQVTTGLWYEDLEFLPGGLVRLKPKQEVNANRLRRLQKGTTKTLTEKYDSVFPFIINNNKRLQTLELKKSYDLKVLQNG